MQKIKGSYDSGVKLSREVMGEMCIHTATYSLLDIMLQPLAMDFGAGKKNLVQYSVSEAHKNSSECLFSDITLLKKLVAQMEADSMRVYRAMETDAQAAKEMLGG